MHDAELGPINVPELDMPCGCEGMQAPWLCPAQHAAPGPTTAVCLCYLAECF